MNYTHEDLERDFSLAFKCFSEAEKDMLAFRQEHVSPSCLCNDKKEIIAIIVHGEELKDLEISPSMTALRYLNLAECKTQNLIFKSGLSSLEHLDLSENKLKKLHFPEGFDALRWLDAGRNKNLQKVTWASGMPILEYLDLTNNKIGKLEIPSRFPKLRYCYLANNNIRKMTIAGRPAALQILDIRANGLEFFPENIIYHSRNLETLYLHGNDNIENIPSSYYANEESDNAISKNIMGYFQSIRDTNKQAENDEVRLVLLGNSTAGKTSLVDYIIDKNFDRESVTTHGIENKYWTPENKDLKVNIWDFGGQEYYHATHRLFLSKNTVVLVLFEQKTNKQGFQPTAVHVYENGKKKKETIDLEHFHYEYWLKSYKYFAKTNPGKNCLVVQSKMDIEKTDPIDLTDSIKKEFGLNASDNQRKISALTAADGNRDSIENMKRFEEDLLKLLEKTKADFVINEDWIAIKEAIQQKREEKIPFVSYSSFRSICEDVNPEIAKETNGSSQLAALIEYLHEIGYILYYSDAKELKDKVFIQPKWLTDIIYRVLDKDVQKKKGRFKRNHIERILEDVKVVEKLDMEVDELVGIMEKFKLVCQVEVEGETEFVAPQYLPDNLDKDTIDSAHKDCNQHVFTLYFPHFLPRSVMTELICEYGQWAVKGRVSKSAIILKDDNKREVLIERIGEEYIRVMSDIKTSDIFLVDLFHRLDKINQHHPSIQVTVNRHDFVHVRKLLKKSPESRMIENVQGDDVNFLPYRFLQKDIAGKGRMGNFPEIMELQENKYRGKLLPEKELTGLDKVRELISRARLEQALGNLGELADNEIRRDSVALLQNRLVHLNKEVMEGVIFNEASTVKRNRITRDILDLAGGIEKETPKNPPVSSEPTVRTEAKEKLRVLFVVGSAPGTTNVGHPTEISKMIENDIQESMRIKLVNALNTDQFVTELCKFNPDILHFSMHGEENRGLAFHSDNKNYKEFINGTTFKTLFKYYTKKLSNLSLVLFNACHSADVAKIVSELDIPSMGVTDDISKSAAQSFSKGFYTEYVKENNIEHSMEEGVGRAIPKDINAPEIIKLYLKGEEKPYQ